MHVISARNVNDAYRQGMEHLVSTGVRENSRAGEVLVASSPVSTVYHRPMERVLFDPSRDANPFFHLMESIWMLAGRRDATWLDQFVSDFSSRFAEDNGDAHGAYGHRWRQHFCRTRWEQPIGPMGTPATELTRTPIDQLRAAAQILLDNPESRQAVISMWDPVADLGAKKRDIPCNDMIMLRGRRDHTDDIWELDITVCCRSNDAVWGCYGANAVHMSFVGEMLAGLAGMRLGRYTQMSNNFHVYTGIMQKVWPPVTDAVSSEFYRMGVCSPSPLVVPPEDMFMDESGGRRLLSGAAARVLEACENWCEDLDTSRVSNDCSFITRTVQPMFDAHRLWKTGDRAEALRRVRQVEAEDWRLAGQAWMMRRATADVLRDVRMS